MFNPLNLKHPARYANWIKKAIKRPGALRKALHVKKGQKIPVRTLQSASKKQGRIGQEARLAQTLSKLRKRKKK